MCVCMYVCMCDRDKVRRENQTTTSMKTRICATNMNSTTTSTPPSPAAAGGGVSAVTYFNSCSNYNNNAIMLPNIFNSMMSNNSNSSNTTTSIESNVDKPVRMRPPFVYRLADNVPSLVREVLDERGWIEWNEGNDPSGKGDSWNLWWKTSRFRRSEMDSVQPWQLLNHFPKTMEFTKKDCLSRNLKRFQNIHGSIYCFSPESFILPNDYTKFVKRYSIQEKKEEWICKPVDLSRGRGIFLFRELSDLLYDGAMVVQKYVSNPLLIGGVKFDLRLYVAVTSFNPLRTYFYNEGLARFGTEKYDLSSLSNTYSHLTNSSINKFAPNWTPGCKWTLEQLRTYLAANHMDVELLWSRMHDIIIKTLLLASTGSRCELHNDSCVELYGFDILVDADLRPWLLEVNLSPALSIDCEVDWNVKHPLINDFVDLCGFTDADRRGDRSHLTASAFSDTTVVSSDDDTHSLTAMETSSVTERSEIISITSSSKVDNATNSQEEYNGKEPMKVQESVSSSGDDSNEYERASSDDREVLELLPRVNTASPSILSQQTLIDAHPDLIESNVDSLVLKKLPQRKGYLNSTRASTLHSIKPAVVPPVDHEYTVSRNMLELRRQRQVASVLRLSNSHINTMPLDGAGAHHDRRIDLPAQVGNFIRIFPFNARSTTLGNMPFDVRAIVNELKKHYRISSKLHEVSPSSNRHRLSVYCRNEVDCNLSVKRIVKQRDIS